MNPEVADQERLPGLDGPPDDVPTDILVALPVDSPGQPGAQTARLAGEEDQRTPRGDLFKDELQDLQKKGVFHRSPTKQITPPPKKFSQFGDESCDRGLHMRQETQ